MHKIFDLRGYTTLQIMTAMLCPLNRHATRCEHNCTDEDLFHNPQWLIQHFMSTNAPVKFAEEHRKEFEREVEDGE